MTDGVTMTQLAASLHHKTGAATDHVCQMALKFKLSCIVYASCVKPKTVT